MSCNGCVDGRYSKVKPVFRGTPGVKLKEFIAKTSLIRHVPTAQPNETGWCLTCQALVPAVGDLKPMFTQSEYKHLSYQVWYAMLCDAACLVRACVRALRAVGFEW